VATDDSPFRFDTGRGGIAPPKAGKEIEMKKFKVWFYHPKGNYFVIDEAKSLEWLIESWVDDPFFLYAEEIK